MIIDVNAGLGPYAFRRLAATTAAEVVASMDRHGLDHAVVTSLPGLLYRDVHRGNEELRSAVAAHPGRFTPIGLVNPAYAGWERDLATMVGEWGWKAAALAPEHHGYALTDPKGTAALARIAELGVPVLLRQRYEDRRQRHAWDRAEDLSFSQLLEVAGRHPRLRFLLVNWLGLDGRRMVAAGLGGRCLVDIARPQVLLRGEIPELLATLGPGTVAFGSNLPFDYVTPSLIKLENLQRLHPGHHEDVAWRNAARFLGVGGGG